MTGKRWWSNRWLPHLPGQVTGYRVTTSRLPSIYESVIRGTRGVVLYAYRYVVTGNLVTLPGREVTNRLPWRGPGKTPTLLTRANGCVTWVVTGCGANHRIGLHGPLAVTSWLAWKLLGSCAFCTVCESCYGAWEQRHMCGRGTIGDMAARDPFQLDRDQKDRDTEYGWGAGKFPDPRIDYSGGGSISGIPIADPDRDEQHLELAMIRRTDVSDPTDQPSPYVCGNTDRFGAQPPLVRETKPPKRPKRIQQRPLKMQRQW